MSQIKEITVQELKAMRESKQEHQLIDVREESEAEVASINGTLIPMGEVPDRINEIRKDIPVIVHCRSGARSSSVIQYLQANHNFTNLFNLKGGILAWAGEIDHTLPTS
ncbi:MAG: rhodanese-like domain-containing protein [Bacteroidia bacterium]|nr:rhodanese-like domain-containing protein [Bacteroidia bacterium]